MVMIANARRTGNATKPRHWPPRGPRRPLGPPAAALRGPAWYARAAIDGPA